MWTLTPYFWAPVSILYVDIQNQKGEHQMKLSEVIGFLEQAYEVLNKHYYDNTLPRVVINTAKARGCYGYFTTSKVWRDLNDCYFEISITPDYGLARDIYSVIATLQHECLHCYCATRNPPLHEVSRNGRYHNKIFRDLAVERDLIIGYDPKIGYSITSPSQNLIDFIDSQGWGNIDLSRTADNDIALPIGTNGRTSKPTHIRKYQCHNCGISVRASKEVRIACCDCDTVMELVEK